MESEIISVLQSDQTRTSNQLSVPAISSLSSLWWNLALNNCASGESQNSNQPMSEGEEKRPKMDTEERTSKRPPQLKRKRIPPPTKADPTLPDQAPFSKEELDISCKVLEFLGKDPLLFDSAACREFRTKLEPLVTHQLRKRSKEVGGTLVRATENTMATRSRHAREQQKKHHDRQLLDKRILRQERLNQMKAMKDIDPRLPMIPDGCVFDGVNSSLGQTSGTSSCVVSIQNDGQHQQRRQVEDGSSVKEEEEELCNPRSCYVCKGRFFKLHHFYDSLCKECADLNWSKRMQTCDLSGKVCLLTGGRVKVGYQIALKLLRNGGTLLMTTRFPNDAAERFAKETDFSQWKDRLKLFGIDLRDLVAVENFCSELLRTLPKLDIIVNNACQTIRRPPAYYSHLMENELKTSRYPELQITPEGGSIHRGMATRPLILLDEHSLSSSSNNNSSTMLAAELTQVPLLVSDAHKSEEVFPTGAFDVNAQQVDYRSETTWTMKLDQVSTTEAVEVFAVNSLAPFVICARLKPLMVKNTDAQGKYVVNVSSMEGKFTRRKDACHPHTNMAKAACNMMTKTSAQDFVMDDIYMTSVDTGWLSIEAPVPTAIKIAQQNFQTPIDEVDGACRVLDPVFEGMQTTNPKERKWGVFLKDYAETEW